ncbi:rod shape-determining protein MreC [Rapidithrix thailandica]|uniref:Cell shape-determining protein MreC n=1 Tax=Rapidithrix thailandica TaxID=413964 RepID=A0AAW9S540_9BACT
MNQLLAFIFKFRFFIVFLALELICMWLIFTQNTYQRYAFLSSSNALAGNVFSVSDNISGYFHLTAENQTLVKENARLRNLLWSLSPNVNTDSLRTDSLEYEFIPAKVVNNSFLQSNNYLTINKGRKHGLKPGMGVISTLGVVGKIKACSENFSTVYSLLHSNIMVSSQLKKSKTLCTTKWEGTDYTEASLLYISRHVEISQGDTVVSSGSNAVFPENILIGVVNKVDNNESESFQNIQLKLATDFSNLSYVYVINNFSRAEKDSLESASTND